MKKYTIENVEETLKGLRDVKSFSIGHVACNDRGYIVKHTSGAFHLYVSKVRNVCYNMKLTLDLYKFGSQKDLNKFLKNQGRFVSFR